ncbi:hypothetical protein CLPUN_52770 [Clostridium puniceum]|uniref:Uncharacterized protein n=1 Tax=Clostridium puniceum TaxID=29367 RepID=A0A1S8SXK1_9CLOT|nr:hypothetical protein [Clostridium puniceum]OOM70163.1 hypothetical protein CLPUN_52770 [Clostridium puniceum]
MNQEKLVIFNLRENLMRECVSYAIKLEKICQTWPNKVIKLDITKR